MRPPWQGGHMLMEVEAVGGVDDIRHLRAPGRQPADMGSYRRVRVHDVELLGAEHPPEVAISSDVPYQIEAALDRHDFDTKSGLPYLRQQRPIGAHPDNVVPSVANAAHEGQEEVVKRKVNRAKLADLHAAASMRP